MLIGILAHNEAEKIGILLDNLTREYSEHDILVISSGSSDGTEDIVREIISRQKNVKLITEEKRRGKSFALGTLLNELNKGYDVLIYMGADNIPKEGAINKLLCRLRPNDVGLVGSRPIPVNRSHDLFGWISHLMWDVHHEISLKEPKISGEMCALKSGIVHDIPPTVINDDAYLQLITRLSGEKVVYGSEVVVYLRGPENVKDFFNQRYRISIGHYQVEQLLGTKLPTTNAKRNVSIAWKVKNKTGLFKTALWFMFFLMLSSVIVLNAWFDFYIRRKLPYKWRILGSTKKVI